MEVICRPNANGSYQTPVYGVVGASENWDAIDDSSSDGDSSYIYTRVGKTEGYATYLFELPSVRGVINSVTITIVRRKYYITGTFDGGVYPALYIPGHGGETYSPGTLGTSYASKSETLTTNPATDAAWTWDDLSTLEIGCYMGLNSDSSSNQIRVTQVYLTIDYTPTSGGQVRVIGMMM